jgi:hypothetical protein
VTTGDGIVHAGIGKTLEAPIEAVEGGLSGNVDADTIVVVEGRLGLSLSVTNPEPLRGGREISSVQASDEDRARVKDELMKKLEQEARRQLAKEMKAGDLLFEDTLSVSQTLSEVYDPPAGAASTKLTLTLQVEFSARYATASDLTELAALALNASLPSGFSAASEALTVKPVTQPVVGDNGSLRWTIRAERRIVQQISNARVTQMIQGIGATRAQALLKQSLPLEGSPEIHLSPSWWPWVPIVPFRISVEVQ